MKFVLVDGSYFIFYRFHALKVWWQNAKKDIPLENPYENELFLEKFKKTFVDKLKDIPKKIGIKKNEKFVMIVGKDCPQKDIWRMELKSDYKGNRKSEEYISQFFKCVYDGELFTKGGAHAIVYHPHLEADDCLALTCNRIIQEEHLAYIITSDMDYLQLSGVNVELWDLKFKKLTDSKSSFNDAKKDLFFKIVMGDKSDNISSIFPKCGPKETLKCYEDESYFQEKLKKYDAYDNYNLNKRLIDFNEIPENLTEEFKKDILKI